MKKKLALTLATVLCLSMFAGCGGGGGTTPSAAPGNSGASEPKETYTITLTHATADTTSLHAGSVAFKEYVEAHSDGRITVNIYPNAQLGGDRETIEGVQTGEVTMMCSSNAVQVNFVPDAVIFDLPFIYPDIATARKVLADETFVKNISASYAKGGFHYLGTSDQGFRTLTLNKEVHKPSDMVGITLRTMENKYHMGTWQAIGANPTPLPFNELYTALQQGTADGQENPIELIYSQKFYEQQKYVINTNHIFQTIVWIMNEDFYQGLPADLKTVIDEGAATATQAAKDYQDANMETFAQKIKDYGVTFVDLTADELQAFADATAPVYDMIKADCGEEVYNSFMAAAEAAKN